MSKATGRKWTSQIVAGLHQKKRLTKENKRQTYLLGKRQVKQKHFRNSYVFNGWQTVLNHWSD
jgi:hypothetical protein